MRNLPRKVNSGFTLIEITLGCTILVVLLGAVGFIHHLGSSAWAKVRTQTEMLQDVQVCSRRLTLELENSCPESLTVTADSVFFLSACDADGRVEIDGNGQVVWQKYVGYYFDDGAGELKRVEVPLAAGTLLGTPVPLQDYLPSTPLTAHQTNGQAVARNIGECRFQQAGDLVSLTLECRRRRYGRQDEESLAFQWEGRPLNHAL